MGFLGFLINRCSRSPERELGYPHPIPALQRQQKATAMTRGPTPSLSNQHLGKDWITFPSCLKTHEQFWKAGKEELPYEEGSSSRGTCRDRGRSHRALGRCRARGVGAGLPWAELSTGNISATFCCCFSLIKIKTYVQVSTLYYMATTGKNFTQNFQRDSLQGWRWRSAAGEEWYRCTSVLQRK